MYYKERTLSGEIKSLFTFTLHPYILRVFNQRVLSSTAFKFLSEVRRTKAFNTFKDFTKMTAAGKTGFKKYISNSLVGSK